MRYALVATLPLFLTSQLAIAQTCAESTVTWPSIVTWQDNNHSYAVVFSDNPTWFEARDAAAAMTLNGVSGHLATFASFDEQEFVVDSLDSNSTKECINQLWLGASQADGSNEPYDGWSWITGEPWIGVAKPDGTACENPSTTSYLRPRSDYCFNNTYFDNTKSEEYAITWWNTGGINDYYHTPAPNLGDASGGPARGFIVEFAQPPINIDIKPGSDPNSINLCSGGTVPIAVLGSPTFDVIDVNVDTLRFAEASVKMVGKKDPNVLCNYEDVNSDYFEDLVCHFITLDIATLDGQSTTATLKGELFNGSPFEGTDTVQIVKDTCY